MPTRSRTRTVVTAGGAAVLLAGAAATATLLTEARWRRTPDPTEGDPLGLPPYRETTVRAPDGADLSVAEMGPDDAVGTVVLAHCWTGDRRVWGPVARLLATDHRVVAYDHRGHGRSSIGSHGLTIDALAADLDAVLRAAARPGEPLVVAGHSMGGMAAQAFAVHHPETLASHVDAIVLVATACDEVGDAALARRFRHLAGSRLLEQAAASPRYGHLLMRPSVGRDVCTSHLRAVADTWVATPASTRVQLLEAMAALDLSAGLPAVDVPVVVVHGARDLLTPPVRTRRIASLLPDVEVRTFEGAGHMLPCEIPEELAAIMREAVARADRRTVATGAGSPA